ncbi:MULTISPECIES: VanZ family protein [unclassified Bradyrhizobium]|uniref:VanZ family protein n=1 Tax=unclassified Bradyrhizobium TaxID=2631580 RepID=UPI002479C3FD|nr:MULTISPECIES: VanZ family protein [unclassified Bradyrhizobium]WGR69670.1 VanZ family protein [Bradyrhizobium sp. ISRA426]WGR81727.1 VanZ family protein [Bradyrhizobium sp. ISRA430]WGR84912.1 VanZ family protein [Bradyrhizobium sp. ISRA432]
MIQRLFFTVGWLALAFIAFVTLSPIQNRPALAGLQLEHFAAFAFMGFAFASGARRHAIAIAVMTITAAVVLESLQLLTPDRHARVLDASVKAIGGVCGVGLSRLAASWLDRIEVRLALLAKPPG